MAQTLPTRSLPALRRALLDWFRANRRALPWREAPSLYKTVVSEFMLQQTQVKTVLPYFARWQERFPDFAALAAAPEADVLKHWEGLGYYSRARNLHKLARAVAVLPAPPHTAAAWEELPGVGPYTAAAIASIACGDAVACVDGNVARVLARLTANATAFASGSELVKQFRPLAAQVLDPGHPGEWNEAMMELGALVCTPRTPACLLCPLREHCATADPAAAAALPRLERPRTEQRQVVRLWCEHAGKLLLHRAAAHARRLAELHELPAAADLGLTDDAARTGVLLLRRSRSITRFRIEESIHHFAANALPTAIAGAPSLHWIALAELDHVALSGPHRRWVAEILAARTADKKAAAGTRRR
ncbi:MAG TPA: A/G-specific adenine glycosylase [Opitutaceae bacterium]|nr:A/G-specific adenine glycosylase [Opitutaceae bacterium]